MSNRGSIFLAIGMLVLGLLIGLGTGGVAGFFMARNTRVLVGQNLPGQRFPNRQSPQSGAIPPTQNMANGVRVIDLEPNSPAATAGLQTGDIITAVDKTIIDSNHSLSDLIQTHKPGDTVALAVTRGNQNMTINVVLGQAPQDSTSAYLGIRFGPAFSTGRRYQIPNTAPSGPSN